MANEVGTLNATGIFATYDIRAGARVSIDAINITVAGTSAYLPGTSGVLTVNAPVATVYGLSGINAVSGSMTAPLATAVGYAGALGSLMSFVPTVVGAGSSYQFAALEQDAPFPTLASVMLNGSVGAAAFDALLIVTAATGYINCVGAGAFETPFITLNAHGTVPPNFDSYILCISNREYGDIGYMTGTAPVITIAGT
jgi:hypothetical protein